MLTHGGRLQQAARHYGIPAEQWLDLSTGISPWAYPIPTIPLSHWNRLPEQEDGLIPAASDYYGVTNLLPVAGSQAAIQALPRLRVQQSGLGRVALPRIGYKEHEWSWQQAGFEIEYYEMTPSHAQLSHCDVVVVINPNNPSGQLTEPAQLQRWQLELAAHGGWLVVDEAFMDCTPASSLTASQVTHWPEGLIVLRSVGKFFGLAGIRLGFIIAAPNLLRALEQLLGPWTIPGPSRLVGIAALQDQPWQQQQRQRLQEAGERLHALLLNHFDVPIQGTPLFQTVPLTNAREQHQRFCYQGVLTRLTDEQDALRIGLPGTASSWQRLAKQLS